MRYNENQVGKDDPVGWWLLLEV